MRNLISILAILLLIRCANQTSPTGGPQDKTPPVLLESSPKNNEKNFKEKSFELTFDEFVKLKNANEEVLITPSLGKKSKIVAKKNKVLIIPEKPLEEKNTTYTINFRDAVQDLNEGNPVFNLRLAFSTGPHIDSLKIVGSVNELFKEEIPDKITVAIYQSDTFNIFKHTPTYFTKATKGKFDITNLKPGEYRIYAFDDKNKNLKVDSKSERFGFKTNVIALDGTKMDSIQLSLVRVDARPLKITSVRNTNHQSKVRFNKALDSVALKSEDYELIYEYGDTQEEVLIFNPPKEDSVQIKILALDSIGNKIDTTVYIKTISTKMPKEKFTFKFEEPKYDLEKQEMTVQGNFNKPLSGFTMDSLYIQLDTTNFLPITKNEISIDPIRHLLKISKKFTPISPKDEKSKAPEPVFIAGKGSFISIDEDTSKSFVSSIKILKEADAGSLSISVTTKVQNYILQLMNSRGKIIKSLKNPKTYTFKNLAAEEYKIRIITDANNNGKWDVGNFEKGIEPEPVFIYRTIDKKYSTPVRANWEVGPLNIKF